MRHLASSLPTDSQPTSKGFWAERNPEAEPRGDCPFGQSARSKRLLLMQVVQTFIRFVLPFTRARTR